MCRQNHGATVDYFALGVIAYEFMMGKRPYSGKSRNEIRDSILAKQVQIKQSEIPFGWSLESADFINKLIQRKPMNRLGYNGVSEIYGHSWFENFSWEKLHQKQIQPPFIPSQNDDNYDFKQVMEDTNDECYQQNIQLLRRNTVQDLFAEYDFQCQIDKIKSFGLDQRSTLETGSTKNSIQFF